MRVRVQNRIESRRAEIRNVDLRTTAQRGNGARTPRCMFGVELADLPEKVRFPAPRMVELSPLAERLTFPVMDIRDHLRFVMQDRQELALHVLRRRLQLCQPGKPVAIEEFVSLEPRK